MSRIFWDTNLFIYLFEDRQERGAQTAALRSRMLERGDELLTSTLTIGEVLVKPVQQGREDLARQYEQRIAQVATIVPFDVAAARAYAAVRQASVKGADAVQLACASAAAVDLFVTNDERLRGTRAIRGIDFIVSLSRVPL